MKILKIIDIKTATKKNKKNDENNKNDLMWYKTTRFHQTVIESHYC